MTTSVLSHSMFYKRHVGKRDVAGFGDLERGCHHPHRLGQLEAVVRQLGDRGRVQERDEEIRKAKESSRSEVAMAVTALYSDMSALVGRLIAL